MRRSVTFMSVLGISLGSLLLPPADAAAPAITIKLSTTTIDVGKALKVSGKAANADKGDPVKVQVQKPGSVKWLTVTTAPATAKHTYATTIKLSTPGDNKVRVKSGKLTSPSLSVRAFTWLRLARQSMYSVTFSPFVLGATSLGSTQYPDSFWSTGSGGWYFHLDRCSSIRYIAGRSGDGAAIQGSFNVATTTSHEGGVDTPATHAVTGDPISVVDAIPLDDTLLSLAVQDFTGSPVATIATPEVHCATASLPDMHPSDLGF